MTTVTQEAYWQTIVNDPTQYGQIQTADAEWNTRAACLFRVLENTLIKGDNKVLVEQWEANLCLTPAAGDTLNDRKAAILTSINTVLPCTDGLLCKSLELIMGKGKYIVERIPEENKLVVHTDRANDTQLEKVTALLARVLPQNIEVVRYNHNIEVSWRDLNKYAECVTNADIAEVNPDWKNDLTSDGEWVFPLTKYIPAMLTGGSGLFSANGAATVSNLYFYTEASTREGGGGIYLCASNKNLKKVVIEQPNLAVIRYNFLSCTNLEEAYIYMPENKVANVFHAFDNCPSLKKLHLVLPKGVQYDHGGDTVNADYLCRNAQLDAESIIRLLDSLPDKSASATPYKIGVGIHVDLQNDPEVLTAIANAEAKGWVLTVRWNGTPTSGIATLDLEEIYAKATILDDEQAEYGDYTDENGNRCMLDWGHYVTDTTGYKLFFSLVEAEQYFKLTKQEE